MVDFLLLASGGGFVSIMVLFLSRSPGFLFDVEDVMLYQTLVPAFIFLFALSLTLFLKARSRLALFPTIEILLLFAAPIIFCRPDYRRPNIPPLHRTLH